MLQSEFTARAIPVSTEEYNHIEQVYLNSDLDKDEFCKVWCKMNASRVKAYKKQQAELKAKEAIVSKMFAIYCKLHGNPYYACDELKKKDLEFLTENGYDIYDRCATLAYDIACKYNF